MLAIGGLCFVIARVVIHTLNKTSNTRTINRIKKDPSFAHRYTETLDIPYSSRTISEYDFKEIRQQLHDRRRANDYRVLLNCNFGQYRFMIFTEFSYVDYDVQATGMSGDTRKKAYHNFIVEFDPAQQMLRTFSNLYSTASEKLQKDGLLHAMLPLPDPIPVYSDDFDEDQLDEDDDYTEMDYDDFPQFRKAVEKKDESPLNP